MARGKNTTRSPEVARKKRPDPAAEAESRLRHPHAVGREAPARFPVGAAIDPDTVPGEAAWLAAGAEVSQGAADRESLVARLEVARRVLLEVGRAALDL